MILKEYEVICMGNTIFPVLHTSGFDVIANMMKLLGNDFLLPIVVLLAIGTGVVVLIMAILDTTKHFASGGRSQSGESPRMIAAKYICAGALIITGSLGGFNLIRGVQGYITDAALISNGGGSGRMDVPWNGLRSANEIAGNPAEEGDTIAVGKGDDPTNGYQEVADENRGQTIDAAGANGYKNTAEVGQRTAESQAKNAETAYKALGEESGKAGTQSSRAVEMANAAENASTDAALKTAKDACANAAGQTATAAKNAATAYAAYESAGKKASEAAEKADAAVKAAEEALTKLKNAEKKNDAAIAEAEKKKNEAKAASDAAKETARLANNKAADDANTAAQAALKRANAVTGPTLVADE